MKEEIIKDGTFHEVARVEAEAAELESQGTSRTFGGKLKVVEGLLDEQSPNNLPSEAPEDLPPAA